MFIASGDVESWGFLWRDDTSAVEHVGFQLRCNLSHIKYSCSLCRSPPFIDVNITTSIRQEILFIHTSVEPSDC